MTSHRFTPTRRAAGLTVLAAIAALAAGCATRPEVRTDQEPGSDLKAYQTFAFYESGSPAYMSLLEKHLRHATRTQLEHRQYRYDEHNPDLRVNYALHVIDRQEVRSVSSAHLRYPTWGHGGVETIDYKQGALAIDLVDAKRNALVWRAVAEGRLDLMALDQPQSAIDATVVELFSRFPGAAKP
jgi:Domain of unknown function (DUF4136)